MERHGQSVHDVARPFRHPLKLFGDGEGLALPAVAHSCGPELERAISQ